MVLLLRTAKPDTHGLAALPSTPWTAVGATNRAAEAALLAAANKPEPERDGPQTATGIPRLDACSNSPSTPSPAGVQARGRPQTARATIAPRLILQPHRLDKQLDAHDGQHVHGTSVGAGHVQGLKAHTSAIDGSMVSDSMTGPHSHIVTCRRCEVARKQQGGKEGQRQVSLRARVGRHGVQAA